MLNQQHGAMVVADFVNQGTQLNLLGGIHARSWFIQCDELGVGGQSAGDF